MKLKFILLIFITFFTLTGCSYTKESQQAPSGSLSASFTLEDVKKALQAEGLQFTEQPVPSELKSDSDLLLNHMGPSAILQLSDNNLVRVYVFSSEQETAKAVNDREKRIKDKKNTVHGVTTQAVAAENILAIYTSYPPSQSASKVQKAIERLNTSATVAWYVTKKKNNSALIINPKPKDYSSTGGIKEFYDAIWVSNFPDEVQIGQKVEVLFDGEIATSYPGQGKAKKITILPSMKPDIANMTEEQIIREAIASKEASNVRIFVVEDIKFDEKSRQWTIQYKDGFLSEKAEERSLELPDR